MKILFVGDVVGKSGRKALDLHLPALIAKHSPECVIVNAENAAHGHGLTAKICDEIFALGVDCITTGNHIWDKQEIIPYIEENERLIRPINYPAGSPGKGAIAFMTRSGRKILVVNAMGRLFMDAIDDPFTAVDALIKSQTMGDTVDAIFVDFHAETTSETMAFGHFVDGRVSAVIGTHTHVPTADHHVLKGGTAYQTDAGMTGCYDSVIGFEKEAPIARFTTKIPLGRLQPSDDEGTLCGCLIVTDDKTGLATAIKPIRKGPWLQET